MDASDNPTLIYDWLFSPGSTPGNLALHIATVGCRITVLETKETQTVEVIQRSRTAGAMIEYHYPNFNGARVAAGVVKHLEKRCLIELGLIDEWDHI